MMKMIPSSPHGTRSMAEKKVFDRLRTAFSGDKKEHFSGYHSMNLTNHVHKRFGEIDFLVCGPPGIFVLEVKGGRVACRQGNWFYTNRYGLNTCSVEGPFKQAQSALHGLMSKLASHFPALFLSQFTIGYGIIFPDCKFDRTGAEWNHDIILDQRGFNNIEGWLIKLFKYWQEKRNASPKTLPETFLKTTDDKALNRLKAYLRPEFETVESLFSQIGRISVHVAKLTEDQMKFLDVIDANPRVLCSGGAGTGKTLLAMELARRWASKTKKVLMPCGSPWLKRYLETRFTIPGLTLTLVESLEVEALRAGVNHFDAMIVDEGQDIFNKSSLNRIGSLLRGGLERGQWCIFHDINNQSGLVKVAEQDAVDYLEGLNPAKVPLYSNCRNTFNILTKVKQTLGADMGVRGSGQGPEVRETTVFSRKESVSILEREVSEIIHSGNIALGSITILSSLPYMDSSAALLPEKLTRQITILDEYSMRNFPPENISFARIYQFKGLENEVIIIVDLPAPEYSKDSLSSHYVSMSRPRTLLSIIFCNGVVHDDRQFIVNTTSFSEYIPKKP